MTSAFDRHTPRTDTTRPARLRRWVIAIGVIAIVGNAAIDAFNQWRAYQFEVADTGRELVNTARILAAQSVGSLNTVDVLLRDVEGLTAPEAASQLSISIGALKSRLHRARSELRTSALQLLDYERGS